MSDRRLPEPDRVHADQMQRITRRLAEVRTRANRGAIRTAGPAAGYVSGNTATVMLSMDVAAGRWAVFYEGTGINVAAITGYEEWSIQVVVFKRGTATQISGPGINVSYALQILPFTPIVGTVDQPAPRLNLPLSGFGDIQLDEEATVSVAVAANQSETSYWYGVRLMLLPV